MTRQIRRGDHPREAIGATLDLASSGSMPSPLQETALLRRARLTFPTWLALLALGVQGLFPLSVGFQIAEHASTPAWKVIADAQAVGGHSHHTLAAANGKARSLIHPVSPPASNHTPHTDPAGGCALCFALQTLQAYTQAAVLGVPLPPAVGVDARPASRNASVHAYPPASYRSRAPPLMA
jgi:hypothetical protein